MIVKLCPPHSPDLPQSAFAECSAASVCCRSFPILWPTILVKRPLPELEVAINDNDLLLTLRPPLSPTSRAESVSTFNVGSKKLQQVRTSRLYPSFTKSSLSSANDLHVYSEGNVNSTGLEPLMAILRAHLQTTTACNNERFFYLESGSQIYSTDSTTVRFTLYPHQVLTTVLTVPCRLPPLPSMVCTPPLHSSNLVSPSILFNTIHRITAMTLTLSVEQNHPSHSRIICLGPGPDIVLWALAHYLVEL